MSANHLPISYVHESSDMLTIHYYHKKCHTFWTDHWSCACDSECSDCGYDIEAASWHSINEPCNPEDCFGGRSREEMIAEFGAAT